MLPFPDAMVGYLAFASAKLKGSGKTVSFLEFFKKEKLKGLAQLKLDLLM